MRAGYLTYRAFVPIADSRSSHYILFRGPDSEITDARPASPIGILPTSNYDVGRYRFRVNEYQRHRHTSISFSGNGTFGRFPMCARSDASPVPRLIIGCSFFSSHFLAWRSPWMYLASPTWRCTYRSLDITTGLMELGQLQQY